MTRPPVQFEWKITLGGVLSVILWVGTVAWGASSLANDLRVLRTDVDKHARQTSDNVAAIDRRLVAHDAALAEIDRGGSTALRARLQLETEVLGDLKKRIEKVEANTAHLPAVAADLEWIKRTMIREGSPR